MPQTLDKRYADKAKLEKFLSDLFADGSYTIDDEDDIWLLTIPRNLSNDEIKQLRGC
ncbi:hypothetical protein B0I37DRAFT_414741 [Chaetomium sp. MPI-CAGE-AT-0009]|nr:hypothetical protein B0I37DRAFT_414741 [Chaetomium sp. MPI-CAGE-AT-0009]